MKKRIAAILLIVTMLLLNISCGTQKTNYSENNDPEKSEASEKIELTEEQLLANELLSSFNNRSITELTIENYDEQRYMLCITIQQAFFDDDPTPQKVRDFIKIQMI